VQAQRYRYKHLNMADLEAQLTAADRGGARLKLIVTDGVFSMDGDVAPLKEIVSLARKFDAQVAVDECHATGVLGATGRGTDEATGVLGEVDIINSTLGKALGGATGGYTTGRADVVELLRQKSRPYLFSNTLAPSVAAASVEVFKMLEEGAGLKEQLERNTERFRKLMGDAGFKIGSGSHPILVRSHGLTTHTSGKDVEASSVDLSLYFLFSRACDLLCAANSCRNTVGFNAGPSLSEIRARPSAALKKRKKHLFFFCVVWMTRSASCAHRKVMVPLLVRCLTCRSGRIEAHVVSIAMLLSFAVSAHRSSEREASIRFDWTCVHAQKGLRASADRVFHCRHRIF
jgi:hypothetical protein